MRVDQVITLVWIGNVALLGATGWVGWKFVQQKKAQRQTPQVVWPDTEAKNPVDQRWPGPITNFRHVWETHLSGLVPPPPKPVEAVEKKPEDLRTLFKNRVQILAGLVGSSPETSAIQAMVGGTSTIVVPGNRIDDWQLVRVTVDPDGLVRATFTNPNDPLGPYDLVSSKVDVKPIGAAGQPPFVSQFEGPLESMRNRIEAQAYPDPATGEWEVPYEEMLWWTNFGQEEVLDKLNVVERPQGLEFASQPQAPALTGSRGVSKGDILVSINDVPMRKMADVLAYFNGPGKIETRFVVVIERDGARRTQVYNVKRRRPAQ